jgi:hypothetical protein
MMNQNDPNVLVIKESPRVLLLICGMVAIFGLFILFVPGTLVGGLVGGLILLGFSATGLILSSENTITMDKNLNRFILRRRYIWRTTTKVHPLDDVTGFELEKHRDSDGDRVYRIIAVLKSGKTIPFSSAYTSGRERKRQRVEQLNQWLGQPDLRTVEGGRGEAGGKTLQANPMDALTPGQGGETAGVTWQVQRLNIGDAPATRWFSPDYRFGDGFLLLAQKPKGMRISGGLLGGLGRMFGQRALSLYGFSPEDSPGIERAAPLEPSEPRLEPYYINLTSNPMAARQALNPWVMPPLVAWAERNPLKQTGSAEDQMQMVILFSPVGLYVAGVGADTPNEIEKLSNLGIELVRALGG